MKSIRKEPILSRWAGLRIAVTAACILAFSGLGVCAEDEPPLPSGLEAASPSGSTEPALPAGLGPSTTAEEPTLPAGLGGEKRSQTEEPALPAGLEKAPLAEEPALPIQSSGETPPAKTWRERFLKPLPFDISGFWETRGGIRLREDAYESDASLAETRLQTELEKTWGPLHFKSTSDFLYDDQWENSLIDLEKGEGWIDLRELNMQWSPFDFMDMKIGRQILTWGTGDLLFINDLFPKDWKSFFIGRDEEYLKAPSDAIKISTFSDWANLNLVYTPSFDSDRFIDGRRVSYYNTMLVRTAGRDAIVRDDKPDDWFHDDEIAARLYKNTMGSEIALYAYHGFWKSPGGSDPVSGKAIFPDLSVYGASVRRTVGKGIGNVEVGYYDSEDDNNGTDPFIRNSQWRFLGGYEQEIGKDFTAAVQYYLEHMMDADSYRRTIPSGIPKTNEDWHVVTLRLTKLLMDQNLILSLFGYYSPSDEEIYFRPHAQYKVNDSWSVEGGANIFLGEEDYTFFGQFEDNSNIYFAVRWSI